MAVDAGEAFGEGAALPSPPPNRSDRSMLTRKEKHRLPLPPALLGGSKSASKSASRSASGDAAERAQKIEGVLSILPMTAKEINAALGTDYT